MNLKPHTLIILSPGFPRDEADTSCLPSQQIFIRALNQNFPDLKIIILSFQYPFTTSTYDWYDNMVIPFNGLKKGMVARLFLWRQLWVTLRKLKRKNDVIGLFSFWCGECAFIGKYFGAYNNIKHFTWITDKDAKKGNRYNWLIRPEPRELIAMSDSLSAEFFKNYGITPAHIIPNGVDPDLFPKRPLAKDIAILGAGALIPVKQYDIFIKVVQTIATQIPGVKAIICGKGSGKSQLQKQIVQCQLQENITLSGGKPHDDILKLMLRSRVFLHTSNYEGFSTVCLEALYAGCYVISFVKPMIHDIDHWIVVKTPGEMAKKL